MPIKNEIVQAVYSMLGALTVFKDRKALAAPIDRAADRFNSLLSSARESFPDSTLVRHVAPLRADDQVIVPVARLAMLKSALDAEVIRLNQGYMLNQSFRYWRHRSGKYYAVGELRHWVDRRRAEFTVYMAS